MERAATEAVAELRTILDLIRWGASRFNQAGIYFGHGTDNAFDEAAYLTLHTLNLPPQPNESYLGCRTTTEEREQVVALIEKRIETRLPAPYLTHEAWFMGVPFYVDERVLIPRSPVAELIQAQFTPWIEPQRVERILDLCTGGGCIAIGCAYSFPGAQVDAADISTDALEVAQRNIEEHGLEERVFAVESDLFAALKGVRYDVIISNPPYVDSEDMAALPEEYRHEPELALAAGDDGLDLALKILYQAPQHLNPQGILIVEVGNSQYALQQLMPELPLVWLEFEHGGSGVFLITREELEAHHESIAALQRD